MQNIELVFRPLDTLFFRELRPHGGPGASTLQSLFPPPVRSLEGAFQQLLQEVCSHAEWPAERLQQVKESLQLRGPYLFWDTQESLKSVPAANSTSHMQRLYPWPAHIQQLPANPPAQAQFAALRPSRKPVASDLGRIYLPELPPQAQQAGKFSGKPQAWLLQDDFYHLLANTLQPPRQIFHEEPDLFVREDRLGLALNPLSHAVEAGNLYRLAHIRPEPELAFGLQVQASNALTESALQTLQQVLQQEPGMIVRLGAEGRAAQVSLSPRTLATSAVEKKSAKSSARHSKKSLEKMRVNSAPPQQVVLIFTTHADFEGDWKPAHFKSSTDAQGAQCWRGFASAAMGIELEIVCAVQGKYLREGGWLHRLQKPRAASPLLPAGSAWFCRVLQGDARLLQGQQLGHGRALGRGEIAIGAWPSNNGTG